MADVILQIKLKNLNVLWATERFLKVLPNDKTVLKDEAIPDINGEFAPNDYKSAFATTKLWVEEILKQHIIRIITKGHKDLQREADITIKTRFDYIE